jgi:hypothetical protein
LDNPGYAKGRELGMAQGQADLMTYTGVTWPEASGAIKSYLQDSVTEFFIKEGKV